MRAILSLLLFVITGVPAIAQDAGRCIARDPRKAVAGAYTVKGSTAMQHDRVIIACTTLLTREPDNVKALLARGDQYAFYVSQDSRESALQIAAFGRSAEELAMDDWDRAIEAEPDKTSRLVKAAQDRLRKAGISITRSSSNGKVMEDRALPQLRERTNFPPAGGRLSGDVQVHSVLPGQPEQAQIAPAGPLSGEVRVHRVQRGSPNQAPASNTAKGEDADLRALKTLQERNRIQGPVSGVIASSDTPSPTAGNAQWNRPLSIPPRVEPSKRPQWERPMVAEHPKGKAAKDPTDLSWMGQQDPLEATPPKPRVVGPDPVVATAKAGAPGEPAPPPSQPEASSPRKLGIDMAAAPHPVAPVIFPTRHAPFTITTTKITTPLTLYAASHALVIGIDGYGDGWGKLGMAVNDAVAVGLELERHGFEVTWLVDREVTLAGGRVLPRRRIDRAALIGAIEAFVYGPGRNPHARLVIWYAGHGHTIDRVGYLVPQGAPNPELAPLHAREDARVDFQSRALPLGRFGEYMREIKARHVLAIFDSCFSGTIFKTRGAPPTGYDIDETTAKPVRHFVASGDAAQEVSDDGKFRQLFVDALSGARDADGLSADQNGDGLVTATELGRYISARTAYYSRSLRQSPQHGKMLDSDYDRGEFVFRVNRRSP